LVKILSAVTKQGHLLIPARYTQEQLTEINKNTSFLCMQCQEEVILKNGRVNIPHFAHKRKSQCIKSFSEGETEDHLNGKLQLYELFKRQNVQVQLEASIPSINQRPDILIRSKENMIAIEFQCSQISTSIITERSKGYQNYSIIPFWILRSPAISEFPTSEIGIMKLSVFKQQFFQSYPTFGKIILTYCPQTKFFHYISNTLHIRSNTFIVKTKKLSLDNQKWPFALVKRISFVEYKKYLEIYRKQRFRQLENLYFYNRRGIQSVFLQICYKWQIYPNKLPLFIGIPTSFAEAFHIHAVEWQLQLVDYLKRRNITIYQVNESHCEEFLYDRPMGSNDMSQKLKAVIAYIEVLRKSVIKLESELYLSKLNYSEMNLLLYREFLAN
jgi:competence protein CoiA